MEPQKKSILQSKNSVAPFKQRSILLGWTGASNLLSYNTSYLSSIKEIPFFIHHGRDARLLFNDLVNKLPEINYAEEDYAAEMSL